jgi:hypothetical protein
MGLSREASKAYKIIVPVFVAAFWGAYGLHQLTNEARSVDRILQREKDKPHSPISARPCLEASGAAAANPEHRRGQTHPGRLAWPE